MVQLAINLTPQNERKIANNKYLTVINSKASQERAKVRCKYQMFDDAMQISNDSH